MTTNLLSVIEQLVEALNHCMDAITERGLNGSPDQAEKWGLQLPLERAYAALAAGQQALEQTQVEAEPEWNDENVIAYCIARGISAAKAFTTGATQPKVEPAPKRCGLCGDCDAKAQKACTVPACFARDDYKPAPSTAGERAQVVEDLLMYAGDNGYGHIDYADTMRHAAALLQSTADHIAQNRKLVAALPVGEQLVEELKSATPNLGDKRTYHAAIAAGQQYLKENEK